MGMFDDITCEHALPGDPQPPGKDFQTKDFDCLMDKYTITADGWLLKDGESVPFHGLLEFHTYSTKTHIWFSYEAKFTDGRLVQIRPLQIYLNGIGGPEKWFYPLPDSATAPISTEEKR